MRRKLGFVAALFLLPLLAGCPFESKAPLGPPSGPLDPKLIGSWEVADNDRGAHAQLLILPFNASEYFINYKEPNSDPQWFRAYPLQVGGRTFLSVNELSSNREAESFAFVRYAPADNGGFLLKFVGEEIVPKDLASDPAGLIEFLKKHLDDPALDDEETILLLTPTPAPETPAKEGEKTGE